MFGFFKKKTNSAEEAKNRLTLQLQYDRIGMNPELVEQIKKDIIQAISKHIDYDPSGVETHIVSSGQNKSMLTASIPINKIRKDHAKKNNR